MERRPVTFTLAELWLLHDFARHEMPEMERWKYPPADLELNEEIALAIDACEADGLKEYTLLLTKQQMLVLDYSIRRDFKTPEGAKGKEILLKLFRARAELTGLTVSAETGRTYKEAQNAAASKNAGHNPDEDADHDTGRGAGAEPLP